MKPASVFLYLGFVFCSVVAAQPNTQAKNDNAQEAAVVQQQSVRVHFENDGTGWTEVTRTVLVQSQAGVEAYGQLVFGYSSATEKLDINYVRVRKPGGQVVDTPAANVQDFAPEVLRSAPMYSDYREQHVTVVDLRPGDVLEYRATHRIVTPLATGEFWYEYSFPRHTTITEARLEIDVPKARELHLKSPQRKYTTAENGDRRVYSWLVQNITPKRKDKDEDDADEADENEDEFPDVQLTTFKDWPSVAKWYAKLQGERVMVDDSIRQKAAELTRGASGQEEKARRIYDYVARNIRYVSLSFGVGRYQPHPANEVLAGSYGDCKDKHTLLSALLRAAGIQSYPVLIDSSRKLDEDVPSPAQFDHVITVAVIDKEWVWLDSTAEVAPFGLILYPLRDKQAVLVSEDANAGLKRTPEAVPVKNTLDFNIMGKVSQAGELDASVQFSANGDSSVFLRAAFRASSQSDWPKIAEVLGSFRGYPGKASDVEVVAVEEPAKPLKVNYKLHVDRYIAVPSTGVPLYVLPLAVRGSLPRKKAGKPLEIGPALEMHSKARLEFAANYTLRLPPAVEITRDYGQYSLKYTLSGATLEAEQLYVIKVNHVPASRRPDVESLRSVAGGLVEQSVTCDARPIFGATSTSAMKDATPQELHKAALKALEQRNFQEASYLLKRFVDQKPDSENAWDELGRAYESLGKHPEAAAAFRKQAEVSPYHKRAWNDLGAELQREGKYEDALSAYGKQLENVPTDSVAAKNHGLLLMQLKRNPQAMTELEKAQGASPGDPDIQLALASLYSAAGNQDKSKSLLLSVTGSDVPAPAGDWFSAALRDNIDPEKSMTDARQILDGIADEFDGGVYDDTPADAVPTMYLLALEWARVGWASFLKGDRLQGLRYLDAAWALSQSGAVASRMARIYQQAGDTANARHMWLLAVAAGGADADKWKSQLTKLAPASAPDVQHAKLELAALSSVKLRGVSQQKGQAEFILVFDGSSRPQRVEFRNGDAEMQTAEATVGDNDYHVLFPENSSLKIVRQGVLSCAPAGCTFAFKPLQAAQGMRAHE